MTPENEIPEHPLIPEPEFDALPVADITATADEHHPVVTQTFPVRQPQDEWTDYQVGVWARTLRRCRKRLTQITDPPPWTDALLVAASLLAGGSLSAVLAGVALDSALGVTFFVIAPPIATAAMVAYVFMKRVNVRSAAQLAEDVLEDLPDPDNTV